MAVIIFLPTCSQSQSLCKDSSMPSSMAGPETTSFKPSDPSQSTQRTVATDFSGNKIQCRLVVVSTGARTVTTAGTCFTARVTQPACHPTCCTASRRIHRPRTLIFRDLSVFFLFLFQISCLYTISPSLKLGFVLVCVAGIKPIGERNFTLYKEVALSSLGVDLY